MIRLQTGLSMYQFLSASASKINMKSHLKRLDNIFNIKTQSHHWPVKSSKLIAESKQFIQNNARLHTNKILLSIKSNKKDIILNDKETKQEMIHTMIKHNHEILRETENRLREKGQFIINDIKETKDKMKEKMEEIVERENVYTIPNLLCVTRIVSSPYLGYLIIQQQFDFAFGLLIIAGITDVLDGWIARKFPGQSSKLGSFLDPMADKVLIATLFLTLTYSELIPWALTGMIIGRDILLVAAGFVIRYKSLPSPRTLSRYFDVTHATAQLAPTFISKVNTAIQLTLVATTLAAPVFGYIDHSILHFLWYTTGATTIAAALSYIVSKDTYKILKK